MVTSVFATETRNSCSGYRGISLIPVVTTILTPMLLHRLTTIRESNVRENQVDIVPTTFLLSVSCSSRAKYTGHWPTISFFHLNRDFDSVD